MKRTKTEKNERRKKGPLDLDARMAEVLFAKEEKVFPPGPELRRDRPAAGEDPYPEDERDPYEENPGDDEPGGSS